MPPFIAFTKTRNALNHGLFPGSSSSSWAKANHSNQRTTEWANKKVVLFAVPGAFTPTCSARHLPGYIENLSALKAKGVDVIAAIAYNDAWVMSAWGKANGIKDDSIVSPIFPQYPSLVHAVC